MLNRLHRLSAIFLTLYALLHLGNHAAGMWGPQTHIELMEGFRTLYRTLFVEVLLMSCVLIQAATGIFFIVRRWGQRRGVIETAQVWSGAYLAFYMVDHVMEVMNARMLHSTDTNFWFMAANFQQTPDRYWLMPYYFLGVLALFVHLGCAFHWGMDGRLSLRARNAVFTTFSVTGAILGLLIVATFAGYFYEIELPPQYLRLLEL